MKGKLVPHLLAVAVAALAVACSDSSNAPLGPRDTSPSLGRSTTAPTPTAPTTPAVVNAKVHAVQWKSPLQQAQSATALIGPEGGEFYLFGTGLHVVVPAGAVSQPTQFAVTARPGRVVAYDFQPEGTHFAVPLRLEQDQSHLARPNTAPGQSPVLQLGYVPATGTIDQATATATVSELNNMLPSPTATSYAFPVFHFSGYIVSWGRY